MTSYISRSMILAGAALSLGGCTMYLGNEDYGYYDPYYDAYGTSGYGAYYGGGYTDTYFGWYDDFYYPGVGGYIYDRRGDRFAWNDRHRRYWAGRRGSHDRRENWDGYRRGSDGKYRDDRRDRRKDRRRARRGEKNGKDRDGRFGDTVFPVPDRARMEDGAPSSRNPSPVSNERRRAAPATARSRPVRPVARTAAPSQPKAARPAKVRSPKARARPPRVERRSPPRRSPRQVLMGKPVKQDD